MVDDVVVDGAPRSSSWIFPSKIVLHSSVHTYFPRHSVRLSLMFLASYTRLDNRLDFSPMRKSKTDKGRVSTDQHDSIRSVVETPNPNFACPHSSACFNVPVACRIESASCSGLPALSRPAAPYQNPDRRLVKPSTEALPANRFLPACRSVPVVDPMAAARRPRLQRRLSRNEIFSKYKYDNSLSRRSLFLTICLLSFFAYFGLSSSVYFLFSLFLCCYFHSISFLSFLLGCRVGRHHQGRIKSP